MSDLICAFEGILRWPKKRSDKETVVQWLAGKFKLDKKYSENDESGGNSYFKPGLNDIEQEGIHRQIFDSAALTVPPRS